MTIFLGIVIIVLSILLIISCCCYLKEKKEREFYRENYEIVKNDKMFYKKRLDCLEKDFLEYKANNSLELSLTKQTNALFRKENVTLQKQINLYEEMAKRKDRINTEGLKVGDTLIIQVNFPKLYSMGLPEMLLKSADVLDISPSKKYVRLDIKDMKESKIVWEKVDNLDIIEIIKPKRSHK
jgi:hypothetical protein